MHVTKNKTESDLYVTVDVNLARKIYLQKSVYIFITSLKNDTYIPMYTKKLGSVLQQFRRQAEICLKLSLTATF